jgi:integrase
LQYLSTKATYHDYCRIVDQYFLTWTEMPTTKQIRQWHTAVKATPHHANKGLKFLKAMFNAAIRDETYVGLNPAMGIKQHKTQSRERVLDHEELTRLLSFIPYIKHEKMRAMLTVLILTGCRLGEARHMERKLVSLKTGLWLQPHTKNDIPHTTYLPTQAREMLAMLPGDGPYFFEGQEKDTCWSEPGVEKLWKAIREALNLDDVRLHDFRRTFATELYKQTKDEYLVKKCINHVNTSVTSIYVRISQQECAKAMQAQADWFYGMTRTVSNTEQRAQPARSYTAAYLNQGGLS